MTIKATRSNETLTINISDKFNFSVRTAFRDAYRTQSPGIRHYVVEMNQVDWLDSSALGMLMLLREFAGGDHSHITIKNPQPAVRKLMEVAQFDELFQIV